MPVIKRDVPHDVPRLKQTQSAFEMWLRDQAADILGPTNEWEVMRFTGPEGVCIVHRNKSNNLSWNAQARRAWLAYSSNDRGWRATDRGSRNPIARRRVQIVGGLLARDGHACVKCGLPTTPDDRTIEHMIPIALGGTSDMSNLTLAHIACNRALDNNDLRAKIEMIVYHRSKIDISGSASVFDGHTPTDIGTYLG